MMVEHTGAATLLVLLGVAGLACGGNHTSIPVGGSGGSGGGNRATGGTSGGNGGTSASTAGTGGATSAGGGKTGAWSGGASGEATGGASGGTGGTSTGTSWPVLGGPCSVPGEQSACATVDANPCASCQGHWLYCDRGTWREIHCDPIVDPPRPVEPRPDAAPIDLVASETGATACTGEYTACGCGCCGGTPTKTDCYFPVLGATVATLAAQDQAVKSSTNCNLVGCSAGTRYVCCPDLPVEPAAAANHSAEWITIEGIRILQLTKSGADCATLWFFLPGENHTSISAPMGWGVEMRSVGGCGEAGTAMVGTSGVGTFTATIQGTTCQRAQVSLHATVFALDSYGVAKAVRLDVDDLLTNVIQPSSACP